VTEPAPSRELGADSGPEPIARADASLRAPWWAWVGMTLLTLASVCLSAGGLLYGYWLGQKHALPHRIAPRSNEGVAALRTGGGWLTAGSCGGPSGVSVTEVFERIGEVSFYGCGRGAGTGRR
jgi:hypothetical protein